MNIFFCEKCGFRVPDADITSGAASSAGEGRFFCTGCVAAKAPPKAPASVHSRRDSTAVLPPPAKTRVLSAREKPREGSMGIAGIVGGIAAIVLLGIVIFTFSGGQSTPRAKPEPEKSPSAKSELTKPEPPPPTPMPPDSLQNSAGENTNPTPVPTGGNRKPPEDEDTPRDMIARREFEAVKAWGKENPADVYAYSDRLAGFIAQNRTSRPGREAVQLLAELKIPSRVNSPLAHWKFDEGSGTSARDAAGTNTGTLKGQVRFVAGRVGSGAVAFDGGSEDYVDLGSDPSLNFSAGLPFTIAGWFRTSEAFATLVSFRKSGDESTVLDIAIGHHGGSKAPGRLMALVRQDSGTNRYGNVMGKSANDGAWHHFALTRNKEGTVRLFLDGEFQSMHTNADSGGALTTDLRSCGLEVLWTHGGKSPDATGQGLKGEMDDFRVYNCALMETEIRELLNAK
jgi:hypothetical protein